jgi:uncharacterized protein DUF4383
MRIELFELLCGMIYLSAGAGGLIPASLMPPPADAPPLVVNVLYGYTLGYFPVNVLETALHLAIGAWGILAWRGVTRSRIYARTLAFLAAALAIFGLIPGANTLFGLMPLHGHDVWFHGVTAVIAVYFGWSPAVSLERRNSPSSDRREHAAPVEKDRRMGHADRRLPNQVLEEKP